MSSPIIIALDFKEQQEALSLVEQLDAHQCRLKIGKEMFTRFGPALVKRLVQKGFDVFLDLKFHDIPNTVAKACQAAADLGVWMLNVHASGGPAMLEAASKSLIGYGSQRPYLTAVTILTSFDQKQLQAIGYQCTIEEQANLLADLAANSGCDGVVTSPWEAGNIKKVFPDLLTVTPGIRLHEERQDDQARIMTPEKAMLSGCDFLVIGRPITQALQPITVLNTIIENIQAIKG